MRFLKQSTSVDVPIGPFVDSGDGVTAETALTITQPDVRLKKNNGNWAQKAAAQTLTHEENGNYEVTLDATDTDTLGLLRLHVAESGALPVWEDFMVMPANVWDSLFGADKLDTGAAESVAGAVGSVTGAVGSVTGAVGSVTGNLGGNVNGNVVGSVGSVSGAVGSVTGAVGSVTGDVGGKVIGGGGGTITGDGVRAASVTGAVGSVTGAVGSVTGGVGGNVAGNVAGDVAGKVLGGGASSITGDGVRAASVTGAVGSVTGAVGSVTGAVGSVTGNVGGNVTGSVGSVVGDVGGLAANAQQDVRESVDADGLDLQEATRVMTAALAGKVSGADTNAPVFRDVADTKDRISATTDADGNRLTVTIDAT